METGFVPDAADRVILAGRILKHRDDGNIGFIENGFLAIRGDEIVALGRQDELGHCPQAECYPDHVVMPGFVNGHHHVGMTPLQMGSPDLPLELWIAAGAARRALDPYLDTLVSAFEMIRSGVTTVQHIQTPFPGNAERVHAVAAEVLRAYEDVGMRASICINARDQSRLTHRPDAEFVATLPPSLQPQVAAFIAQRTMDADDYLGVFRDLYEQARGSPRLAVQLAPANLHWCSDAMLRAFEETSQKYRVPMHMHLLETAYQAEYARNRTGTSAIRHLDRLGLLTPRMTLGHGVWVDEDDIDLIAERGVCICHNCSSNMRLGSGRAPVSAYLARKVTVGLGIDEAGINDDRDMLLEMRLVLYSHRLPGHDRSWLTASDVLRMATLGGAATTPFAAGIGKLVPGAKADFTVVDWHRLTYPYQDARIPTENVLVQRMKPTSVAAVYIAGEKVLSDGRMLKIDPAEIYREIAERLSRPRSEIERLAARMADEILPHVRRSYSDYSPPCHRPHIE